MGLIWIIVLKLRFLIANDTAGTFCSTLVGDSQTIASSDTGTTLPRKLRMVVTAKGSKDIRYYDDDFSCNHT